MALGLLFYIVTMYHVVLLSSEKILKHIYHPYFIPYLLISLGLSSFGYLHQLDPPADNEYSL